MVLYINLMIYIYKTMYYCVFYIRGLIERMRNVIHKQKKARDLHIELHIHMKGAMYADAAAFLRI